MSRSITKDHRTRVHSELKSAGVSGYALLRAECRYLPSIIHETEQVKAAVYGHVEGAGGALLVATNKRVIYLNRMPLFTTLDEVTYDLVSGISKGSNGLLSSVTLHTRAGDYTVRFGNLVSVAKFVNYIENKCIEVTRLESNEQNDYIEEDNISSKVFLNSTEKRFIENHEVAVLSTIDRSGNLDGATVYYCTVDEGIIHIITKGGTQKMHNIFANPQVAITIHDEQKLQTLQMHGLAKIETNQNVNKKVFAQIVREREYEGEKRLPPVTQLHEESFMVLRIIPTAVKYRDFKASEKEHF